MTSYIESDRVQTSKDSERDGGPGGSEEECVGEGVLIIRHRRSVNTVTLASLRNRGVIRRVFTDQANIGGGGGGGG